MKIGFRTRWGIDYGLGHVVRCVALAQALALRGIECRWHIEGEVDRGRLPPELCALQHGRTDDCDAVVIDDPRGRPCRDDRPTVWISDLDPVAPSCDLLIDPVPDAPGGEARLGGAAYALIRSGLRAPRLLPSFRRCAKKPGVLIMMGGTDPCGIEHDIGKTVAALGLEARICRGVSAQQVASTAHVSDCAVIACGLGAVTEMAFLRLPFVAIESAPNQRRVVACVRSAWGLPVIRIEQLPELPRLVADLCAHRAYWAGQFDRCAIDGKGAERVASAILALIQSRCSRAAGTRPKAPIC